MNAVQRFRKTPKGVLTNIYNDQKTRCRLNGWDEPEYTLKEFHDIFLKNKKFIKLFGVWSRGGHEYYDKPSIDRKDCTKGYLKSNVQVLTWRENRKKGEVEKEILCGKSVIKFSMKGRKIEEYKSIKEAVRKTNCNQSLISLCCSGKRNHTGGFKWAFKKLNDK